MDIATSFLAHLATWLDMLDYVFPLIAREVTRAFPETPEKGQIHEVLPTLGLPPKAPNPPRRGSYQISFLRVPGRRGLPGHGVAEAAAPPPSAALGRLRGRSGAAPRPKQRSLSLSTSVVFSLQSFSSFFFFFFLSLSPCFFFFLCFFFFFFFCFLLLWVGWESVRRRALEDGRMGVRLRVWNVGACQRQDCARSAENGALFG